MVRPGSAVRGLADLKDKKLGVAGGPVDKSWLVVQAASRATTGTDLLSAARVVYGAPPLLDAKLRQGELDAVPTFWNFTSRLEAAGCREAVSVADCARALGLPAQLNLVGFVFREDWAEAHRHTIDGFLAAAAAAEHLMATSADEWTRIRPLMDASDDTLFSALRRRFVEGIATPLRRAGTTDRGARLRDPAEHRGHARNGRDVRTAGRDFLPRRADASG